MSDVPCFVGIDVAKAQWDIAVRPSGERWAVPNDASGVATRVKPCHHFLYSGGAFVRLYPVNLTPTRNHAANPKRRLRGRYRFALDMW